ncbi:MAG TPA: hypothetical protein VNM47_02630 [Terriglobia bacterium]|nr:hypothetical protein [Terriglobia bacterium]
MCNQSVGLIAGVIEKAGIATIGLSLLRMVTERVRPPRALFVPYPFGYPLGKPNDARLQHRIIRAALNLLESAEELPILQNFVAE